MAETIIECVIIGFLTGGWMESTYWTGCGYLCGAVIGFLSWALIAGWKFGRK